MRVIRSRAQSLDLVDTPNPSNDGTPKVLEMVCLKLRDDHWHAKPAKSLVSHLGIASRQLNPWSTY